MNLLPGPMATGLLSELTAPLRRNEETARISSSPALVRRVDVLNFVRFILLSRKGLWIRTEVQAPDERSAVSIDIGRQRLRDDPRQKLTEHPLVREFSEGHILPRDPRAVLRIRIGDSEGVPSRMPCDEYELLPAFALRQNSHSFIRVEVPQLFEQL